MNLLFLGGNRFFGKKLLKKLSAIKKFKIFVLNRGNKKIEKNILDSKNIVFIKCDRKNLIELKKKLKNIKFDVVFDNCAYSLADVKNLLKNLNKNVVYIFSSTVMSYLNLYLKKKLKENDWHDSRSTNRMNLMYQNHELIYAKNKRSIENFLIRNKKIKYIILRIHNVIGIDDFSKKTSMLFNSRLEQVEKLSIKKNDYLQFVYDQDLIKIITKIMSKNLNNSKIYNICNDPIKVEDFYKNKTKYFKNNFNFLETEKFPFPKNVIMKNNKVKNELNIKFSPINKIFNEIAKSDEFK